jgi:uncharacterized protein YijF (DUF1287 family)
LSVVLLLKNEIQNVWRRLGVKHFLDISRFFKTVFFIALVILFVGLSVAGCGKKPSPGHPPANSAKTPVPPDINALVLLGAKEQLKKPARYLNVRHHLAYPGGDVLAGEGVCTDVVVRAYRRAGLDLQELIHQDRLSHPNVYPQRQAGEQPDPDTDHRRDQNQFVFFNRFARSLPLGTEGLDLKKWRGGDVVVYSRGERDWHVAIVSDKHDQNGIPYLIDNHPNPGYVSEKHSLNDYQDTIGHFRWKEN